MGYPKQPASARDRIPLSAGADIRTEQLSDKAAKRINDCIEKFAIMSGHGTVEYFQAFDVHTLHRKGAFTEELRHFPWVSFTWPWLVRLTVDKWHVDIEFRRGARQRIKVVWTPCGLGGFRPWYKCRDCDRRVGKLYNSGASLNCRECNELWYSSQRRGAKSRIYLQALKLRLRLNGIASLEEPIPPRPKGMHERTYQRLRQKLEDWERQLGPKSRFLTRETDYGPLVPK